jgi:antirestriction protein ArdC
MDAGRAPEERAAEIGSAFPRAALGLTPEVREDHAASIADGLQVLADDKKAIFTAARHAQKAADFLRATSESRADPEEPERRAA